MKNQIQSTLSGEFKRLWNKQLQLETADISCKLKRFELEKKEKKKKRQGYSRRSKLSI